MMRWKAKGRTRRVPGEMSKTEQRYARFLEDRRLCGDILAWSYESHGFKLAKGVYYYPDFEVMRADQTIEYHEVKGTTREKTETGIKETPFFKDGAREKPHIAAEKWPYYRWVICYESKTAGWIEWEL